MLRLHKNLLIKPSFRNASNALIANSTVGMKISILKTTNAGAVVYSETQSALTNSNGLVSIQIGNGAVVSGSIATINWAADAYFIKTEVDPAGGTSYSIAATSQLLSVPYALSSAGGNISGTAKNLVKFTGANTGGNSIIIEDVLGIGIGTVPTTNLEIKGARTTALGNLIITETDASPFPGITLNNSASAAAGVNLYGRNPQGLNVVNLAATTYAPVYASAFTVSSDKRTKKEIQYLKESDYDHYLKELRNISSATYRYNWEDESSRPVAHLGFISQSLPTSVQMEMDANPSKSGENIIGYNLSDMAGLTVIIMKALDAKVSEQAELIKKLEKRLDALERK